MKKWNDIRLRDESAENISRDVGFSRDMFDDYIMMLYRASIVVLCANRGCSKEGYYNRYEW